MYIYIYVHGMNWCYVNVRACLRRTELFWFSLHFVVYFVGSACILRVFYEKTDEASRIAWFSLYFVCISLLLNTFFCVFCEENNENAKFDWFSHHFVCFLLVLFAFLHAF